MEKELPTKINNNRTLTENKKLKTFDLIQKIRNKVEKFKTKNSQPISNIKFRNFSKYILYYISSFLSPSNQMHFKYVNRNFNESIKCKLNFNLLKNLQSLVITFNYSNPGLLVNLPLCIKHITDKFNFLPSEIFSFTIAIFLDYNKSLIRKSNMIINLSLHQWLISSFEFLDEEFKKEFNLFIEINNLSLLKNYIGLLGYVDIIYDLSFNIVDQNEFLMNYSEIINSIRIIGKDLNKNNFKDNLVRLFFNFLETSF